MKNINYFFFLLLFGSSICLSQNKTFEPALNEKFSDSLKTDVTHTYTVELDSARFVYGKVKQESVDVVIRIMNPENNKIEEFDGPARGNEIFLFETEKSGEYQIVVSPFEQEEGKYSFELEVIEPVATTPEAKADQLMLPYSGNDIPGGVILVMKDVKTVFEKGYGMANLAYYIPFKTSTSSRVG